MEYTKYPVDVTLSADVDQYQLVVDGGAGTFAPTAAITAGNGGAQVGIAQVSAESGDKVSINFVGVDKAIAAGPIDRFDEVIPGALGRVTALDAQENVIVVGKALEAATAAGDLILVALYVQPRLIPA
jgi:hypothetical protein